MSLTAGKSTSRKAKKSYTLSAEAVAFLETLRKRRHSRSASAILEELVQNARRDEQRRALDKATEDYYNSRTSEDQTEEKLWGEFALQQFRPEVD